MFINLTSKKPKAKHKININHIITITLDLFSEEVSIYTTGGYRFIVDQSCEEIEKLIEQCSNKNA